MSPDYCNYETSDGSVMLLAMQEVMANRQLKTKAYLMFIKCYPLWTKKWLDSIDI